MALFALLTTPKIEIADQTFNPIDEMSTQELLEQFQSRLEGFTVDGKVGEQTVETLGADATVEKYAGSVEMEGQRIDVYLHVTRFEHGDDFVVGVNSYPQQLNDESENVEVLLSEIRH